MHHRDPVALGRGRVQQQVRSAVGPHHRPVDVPHDQASQVVRAVGGVHQGPVDVQGVARRAARPVVGHLVAAGRLGPGVSEGGQRVLQPQPHLGGAAAPDDEPVGNGTVGAEGPFAHAPARAALTAGAWAWIRATASATRRTCSCVMCEYSGGVSSRSARSSVTGSGRSWGSPA